MTLLELSEEYEKSADLLRKRLAELRRLKKTASDPEELWHIKMRIKQLTPLLTEMRAIAELTRNYYQKGYYRNELYTCNGFRNGRTARASKKDPGADYCGTIDGIPEGYASGSCDPGRVTDRVRKKKRRQQKYGVQDPAPSSGKGQTVQPVSMNDEEMERLCGFLHTVDI